MSPPIELIFGAFTMNTYTPEIREEFLKLLEEYDVKAIDTAYSYVSVIHTSSRRLLEEPNVHVNPN